MILKKKWWVKPERGKKVLENATPSKRSVSCSARDAPLDSLSCEDELIYTQPKSHSALPHNYSS